MVDSVQADRVEGRVHGVRTAWTWDLVTRLVHDLLQESHVVEPEVEEGRARFPLHMAESHGWDCFCWVISNKYNCREGREGCAKVVLSTADFARANILSCDRRTPCSRTLMGAMETAQTQILL